MASFPLLKTGAVAQYPSERQLRFNTQVLEFIDGSEQRFRDYTKGLRRWVIRLDQLDAGELQAVVNFFDAVSPIDRFSFDDPWDGKTYGDCSIDDGELVTEFIDEWRGRTQLVIRENRS